MGYDSELIGSEFFNLKIKNYLRDFYIYNFKEKGFDFKARGSGTSNENKKINDPTFNPDTKRLQFALEKAAGIKWSKGDFVDISAGKINIKKQNNRVECITVDSRKIENNPFFSIYQICSESSQTKGTHFALIYGLILYFQLGINVELFDFKPLTIEQQKGLQEYLICSAEIIESETRRHGIIGWKNFSDKDKNIFSLEAINKFELEHDEVNEIYEYIVKNRQQIVYKDGNFFLTYDQSDLVEFNRLYNALTQLGILGNDINKDQKKQFSNKMHELTRLGIVKREKRGQRVFYGLSDLYLSKLLSKDKDQLCRLKDCIRFFAQTSLLGEIGTYLLSRFEQSEDTPIRFKHNYIKRALNDYNNIDLLYAIKNNFYAFIEYRNASQNDMEYQKIFCYPLEIRESVTDGRQYLVYYHPGFRSVSTARIEFIDSIVLGTLSEKDVDYFHDDILRAKKLILNTWGTAFDNFREGNVKIPFVPRQIRVVVCFDENEFFIKSRLQRETRNRATTAEIETAEFGNCMEIVAQVANPLEMVQWLRSYTTRVVSVEIDGKAFDGFTDDVIKTYKSYLNPSFNNTENISSRIGKSLLCDEIPANFKRQESLHSLLFNEIFGISFTRLGDLLLTVMSKSSFQKSELNQMEIEYAKRFYFGKFSKDVQFDTEDKRIEQAEGFADAFVIKNGNKVFSKFKLCSSSLIDNPIDLLPLTSIEIQWLKNILSHPIAMCFLSETEIKHISKRLEESEIFDVNTVVLYDQYIHDDSLANKPDSCNSVQKIMRAIRDCNMITLRYKSQYGIISDELCAPVCVEYSKRDNRIRIHTLCKSNIVKTFNLERIVDIKTMDEKFERSVAETEIENYLKKNECELVLFFNETKNVPDRILTEFSCFKKKCVKWGNERYRMTLCYDKEDSREILVRLLSYGSLINVFNDTGDVRHELIDRLENQLELTNSMDLVFASEPKEKE